VLFALLFSSPESVTLERIRQVLYPATPVAPAASTASAAAAASTAATAADATAEGAPEESPAEAVVEVFSPREHLEALEVWMAERNLPLSLHQVGRSWRLLTAEELAEDLISVRRAVTKEKIGPASLEVLALVAYRQPVLKADIDAIRGVKSGSHLRHLLDLRLVKILGRAELPGRPFLYGTTKEFLDRFGLRDLEDLPEAGRLASPAEQAVGKQPQVKLTVAPDNPEVPEISVEPISEVDSELPAQVSSVPISPAAESSTGK